MGDMASVQLMLRLPHTTAGEAMAAMDTARDPLMPMPTTAGEDMAPTDMERGLLMPMPTTGEAMAIGMASVQLMLRLPLTMAAGAMAAMDMARGLLMLRLPHTT